MSHFLLQTLKQALPKWNEQQLTENDFIEEIRIRGLVYIDSPHVSHSEYVWTDSQTIIAVNSSLSGFILLEAMWHEFAHHVLHHPAPQCYSGKRTKEEMEAEIVAVCAVIPRTWLSCRTIDEMIVEGVPRDIIERRARVFENSGI